MIYFISSSFVHNWFFVYLFSKIGLFQIKYRNRDSNNAITGALFDSIFGGVDLITDKENNFESNFSMLSESGKRTNRTVWSIFGESF